MVLCMKVALSIDTLGVIMVTQLPGIPRTYRIRVEHKLLSFGHSLISVLIRRVLFLIYPCVGYGYGNWLDRLALGCAWVADFFDREGDGLSVTQIAAPFWVLCRHDVVVAAQFHILEGKVRIKLVGLLLLFKIDQSMLVDIVCSFLIVERNVISGH